MDVQMFDNWVRECAGSLSTYTYGNYGGVASGGSFVYDYDYGDYVLLCSRVCIEVSFAFA
jgi:hypothetical protein